ncbi:MAG: hypothetical protein PQJ49_10500 [Sphaerochaetaceae bacterium]|nr:hypothetical protein [Sphaerochaetaceae bacterium]
MILESGMNLFPSFYYSLSGLTTTESKISDEVDFGSPAPFKKGGSKSNLLAYCLDTDEIKSTGTNVVISFFLQSKDKGGSYDASINIANIKAEDIVPGEPIIDMILPKNTKQIVSLKAKLSGTTPAFTGGKLFANIQPYIG